MATINLDHPRDCDACKRANWNRAPFCNAHAAFKAEQEQAAERAWIAVVTAANRAGLAPLADEYLAPLWGSRPLTVFTMELRLSAVEQLRDIRDRELDVACNAYLDAAEELQS